MDVWMDEWMMDGSWDRWKDGQMNGWMVECVHG